MMQDGKKYESPVLESLKISDVLATSGKETFGEEADETISWPND